MGNLYFVHDSLQQVKTWNFLTHNWEYTGGKSIYTGNIETISSKEKSKFPQHFFPEVIFNIYNMISQIIKLLFHFNFFTFVNLHKRFDIFI